MVRNEAIVLFSGGQDSTTCLAWSLDKFEQVSTVGFQYGQRHAVELSCRKEILNAIRKEYPSWNQKLKEDRVINLDFIKDLGANALTEENEIKTGEKGLPTTFVPGRNIFFLSASAAIAYQQSVNHIVGGMCETDFSGYPDCRNKTIESLQETLSLGMDAHFEMHTPLMWLNKAQTWAMAKEFGGDKLVDLIIQHTHTCYLGERDTLHAWGYGCGRCPACLLRAKGYQEFIEGENNEL